MNRPGCAKCEKLQAEVDFLTGYIYNHRHLMDQVGERNFAVEKENLVLRQKLGKTQIRKRVKASKV